MICKFTRTALTKSFASKPSSRTMSIGLQEYGEHLFNGAVAERYLEKQGLSASILKSSSWMTNGNADKVDFNFYMLHYIYYLISL